MKENTGYKHSRRAFLKHTSRVAAASAVAAGFVPRMYAAEKNTIKLALVGCGGRGTGAASNALSVKNGPIKLVAMGDVFADRLGPSLKRLKSRHTEQVDVPPERQFVGFDAYTRAMDCLSAGDVVILGTPPAFRWVHFKYAIEKGIHVFMRNLLPWMARPPEECWTWLRRRKRRSSRLA
jgi:hypothetical protein